MPQAARGGANDASGKCTDPAAPAAGLKSPPRECRKNDHPPGYTPGSPGICSCPSGRPQRLFPLHARVERLNALRVCPQKPAALLNVRMSALAKTQHMSDQDTSGAPLAAPASPAAQVPAGFPAAASSFGATRGSGLARSKRPAQSAASPAASPAAPSGYKPTTIEIIKVQSEYRNPFAPEVPAAVPAPEPAPVAAPVVVIAPAPAAVSNLKSEISNSGSAPVAAPAPVPAPTPVAAAPVRNSTPEVEHFPFTPKHAVADSAEKPSLTILPPAESRRVAQSWENASAPAESARPERPTFRPESREPRRDARPEQRDARPDQREPRPDQRNGNPASSNVSRVASPASNSAPPCPPRPRSNPSRPVAAVSSAG